MSDASWYKLGNSNFRKFELYRMNWAVDCGLSVAEHDIAAAKFGGPIATSRKAMYLRSSTKQSVTIFNAAGKKLHEIKWAEGGVLVKFAWSMSETLICVQDDGLVLIYDIFGNLDSRFDMGQEAKEWKITDCKICPSYNDTCIAVMTTAYSFFIRSEIKGRSAARKLADIPGLNLPPSSWACIPRSGNMCVLVAKEDQLYLIDQLGQCQRQEVNMSYTNVIAYVEMAMSANCKYLALMTASGYIWIGSIDLQVAYCEFNTEKELRPTQMCWCGSSSVLLQWGSSDILMVGSNMENVSFDCDVDVVLVQEIDGARVISDDLHEFIEKVPEVTVKVFDIVSTEPGAYLFEAERKFRNKNKEAHSYLSSIDEQMVLAVEQCIEAAGNEYDPSKQQELLKAAAFGKCFANTADPDEFYRMCQMIRVLNAVRDYKIGIPLTLEQLKFITVQTLMDRLVYRRQYLLAQKICAYLRLKDHETKIRNHWACNKVENSRDTDEQIATSIQQGLEALGGSSGVSFSEIASKAFEKGKRNLALKLLKHETLLAEQIPLLLKMEEYDAALEKVIESGDSNLVYKVMFDRKDKMSLPDFLLEIRKSPDAVALLMKYYASENEETLESLYQQEDRHYELANRYVLKSLRSKSDDVKRDFLIKASGSYKNAAEEFSAKMTEEELRLMNLQQQFENQGIACLNQTLHETVNAVIKAGKNKEAETLRKEFNIPERRFWWLKVNALAEAENWTELENLAKSKKQSPIGYRPFVEACWRAGNSTEESKYLNKVLPDEKVKCLISIGKLDLASEVAFERQNEDELNLVLQRCTPSDRAVFDKIIRLKAQLKSS